MKKNFFYFPREQNWINPSWRVGDFVNDVGSTDSGETDRPYSTLTIMDGSMYDTHVRILNGKRALTHSYH